MDVLDMLDAHPFVAMDRLRDVIYCWIFVSYARCGLPLPNELRLRLWFRSTLGVGVVISRLGQITGWMGGMWIKRSKLDLALRESLVQ